MKSFILENFDKNERKVLRAKVLDLYESNTGPKEIARLLSVPINYVHRVVAKSTHRISKPKKEKINQEILNLGFKMDETNSKVLVYCQHCNKESSIVRAAFKKIYIDNNKTYTCKDCYNSLVKTNGVKKRKFKSNKSGYIGVLIKKYEDYNLVVGKITRNGQTIFLLSKNVKFDEDLNRSVLDVAIKRELFIINECQLLVTRNFSNEELISIIDNNIQNDYKNSLDNLSKLKTKLGI